MAIESGFALAQILRHWDSDDLGDALQFFQDFRKPRTDKITKTSYEAGKLASADIPEELWASSFSPAVVRDRMRWVMEYDLLGDLYSHRLGSRNVPLSSDAGAGIDSASSGQVASVL
jgi:salicylate hydroxylase